MPHDSPGTLVFDVKDLGEILYFSCQVAAGALYQQRSAVVPKCPHTSAEMSWCQSVLGPNCLDTSACVLVPKCLGSEVSGYRGTECGEVGRLGLILRLATITSTWITSRTSILQFSHCLNSLARIAAFYPYPLGRLLFDTCALLQFG